MLGGIDLDPVGAAILPVCGEDNDGFGFDLGRDLPSDCTQPGIGGVVRVFYEVGPANGEEVDRCPGRTVEMRGVRHEASKFAWWIVDLLGLVRRTTKKVFWDVGSFVTRPRSRERTNWESGIGVKLGRAPYKGRIVNTIELQ